MTRLPVLRPQAVLRALQRAGFALVRTRGSHYQLLNAANGRRVTVPFHGRDLSRATIASIINQAGLSVGEFLELL